MPITTRIFQIASAAVFCAALAACGGGGGGGPINPPTNPPSTATPSPTPCPAGYTGTAPNCTVVTTASASVTVQAAATTAPLPSVGGYAPESIALPSGSGTLSVTVSTQPPAGTSQLQDVYRRTTDAARRTMSTGNSPYLYFTLTASGGPVTLGSLPGLNFTLNSSAPQDINYQVAEWDSTGQGWFVTGENAALESGSLQLSPSSAPSTNALTIATNQSVCLAIYHGTSVPSPAPQSVISGMVVDYNSHVGIAGATVQVVPLEQFASTAGFTPLVTTTTAADGTFTTPSFTVQGHRVPGNGQNMALFVLPPSGDSAHTAAHTWLTVASGTNALTATLPLVKMTANEQAWVAQVNSDRSANGVTYPLTADSYALLAARWKAQQNFTTCDHTTFDALNYFISLGGIDGINENIACPALNTWQGTENAILAEKGTSNDGHYLNLVNPQNLWIGVGSYTDSSTGYSSFAQEFVTTF